MGATTAEQQKLVLNMFALTLQNNLVTASAVSWNEMDAEMDDRNGLQVLEQITPRYNVTRTENGVKDLSSGTDGTVFGSELFEVTGTFNANMGWGDFVKIKTIGDARESKALLGAATSMAEKIDAYILGAAALASADWLGDGISSIDEWVDAAAAYARLKENGVDDSDLSYIFNHTDQMKLGDQVVNLPGPDNLSSTTFRSGFSGKLSGIRTMFTNQLPVMTTGTRAGTIEIVPASSAVNYADVAKAGTINGQHMSQTISINGLSGATQYIMPGEVFTIEGVFAYDNRKQAPVTPARLQQFTVLPNPANLNGGTGDGRWTAGSNAIPAMRIFPAIIVPGFGSGDNININTAHATVTADPAAGADVVFLGAASTALSPRVLIQKQSVVVNTVPLIMPANAPDAMRRRLKNIPISVRMWPHSAFGTGEHGVRFDVALNVNIRERLRIARVNGS